MPNSERTREVFRLHIFVPWADDLEADPSRCSFSFDLDPIPISNGPILLSLWTILMFPALLMRSWKHFYQKYIQSKVILQKYLFRQYSWWCCCWWTPGSSWCRCRQCHRQVGVGQSFQPPSGKFQSGTLWKSARIRRNRWRGSQKGREYSHCPSGWK